MRIRLLEKKNHLRFSVNKHKEGKGRRNSVFYIFVVIYFSHIKNLSSESKMNNVEYF